MVVLTGIDLAAYSVSMHISSFNGIFQWDLQCILLQKPSLYLIEKTPTMFWDHQSSVNEDITISRSQALWVLTWSVVMIDPASSSSMYDSPLEITFMPF